MILGLTNLASKNKVRDSFDEGYQRPLRNDMCQGQRMFCSSRATMQANNGIFSMKFGGGFTPRREPCFAQSGLSNQSHTSLYSRITNSNLVPNDNLNSKFGALLLRVRNLTAYHPSNK
eukprot:Gregarina_sp_Poly_1__5803@NODE_3055_length_1422_cov_4_856089_g1936_i0_p1_GENE_NODE_3055_length_1422_cov_4_856089_g1936_i0NODE_3055_length_1422_cov_4_856089_g1936_i0_p1_ORF_typecomplete_len118_score2_07_NODE_3055_length_1422_cov_4_856089_g1936_i0245598